MKPSTSHTSTPTAPAIRRPVAVSSSPAPTNTSAATRPRLVQLATSPAATGAPSRGAANVETYSDPTRPRAHHSAGDAPRIRRRPRRFRSRSRCQGICCCCREPPLTPAPTAVATACCCCSARWRWESSRSRASRCCGVSGGLSCDEAGRVGGGAGGGGRDGDGRVGGVGGTPSRRCAQLVERAPQPVHSATGTHAPVTVTWTWSPATSGSCPETAADSDTSDDGVLSDHVGQPYRP